MRFTKCEKQKAATCRDIKCTRSSIKEFVLYVSDDAFFFDEMTHTCSFLALCFFLSSSDDLYSYTILDVSPGAVLCVSVCLSCCKTNVVNTPKNIKKANRYLNLCWERCDQPSNHPHNGQCKVTVCVIVICRCRCVLGSCIFPQNIRKYSYAECSNAMAHIVERARVALAMGQVSIAACI